MAALLHQGSLSVFLIEARRTVNVNPAQRVRMEADFQSRGTTTDYDFDREQWQKQMRIATMDCVLDPDITTPSLFSFNGLKRRFKKFFVTRKLLERRPTFSEAELQELFCRYKELCHTKSTEDLKYLSRITTQSEAVRISKDIQGQLAEQFSQQTGKYKALRMVPNKTTALPTANVASNSSSSSSNDSSKDPSPTRTFPRAACGTYEIQIDTLKVHQTTFAQMAQEDWIQVTTRCEFRERNGPNDEWQSVMEYPVFEVKLGDGINSSTTLPFIVVAVIKKDGTRYGKDTQDADQLRKSISRQRWW